MVDRSCNNCKYENGSWGRKNCRACATGYSGWELKEAKKVTKNYVKEFMDDNWLEIGVEFPIITYNENDDAFYFDDKYNLRDHNGEFRNELLLELLLGTIKVMPPPFSPTNLPKEGERVWYVAATGIESLSFNLNFAMLYALVASGNAFRTEAEAEEAAPRIRKEQGMIKE